ncbi:unnamed protein product [Notodromas monacha]|uniref:Uncharacterized protein n=1 Tax=Notodromas monacha TaxID=399045 RepID=A0A7R9GGF8_9CRUS|nr:unnamed protein product [Notodromas monacha]CAG0920351.1 unnamed protein product [Notodromas monacha]
MKMRRIIKKPKKLSETIDQCHDADCDDDDDENRNPGGDNNKNKKRKITTNKILGERDENLINCDEHVLYTALDKKVSRLHAIPEESMESMTEMRTTQTGLEEDTAPDASKKANEGSLPCSNGFLNLTPLQACRRKEVRVMLEDNSAAARALIGPQDRSEASELSYASDVRQAIILSNGYAESGYATTYNNNHQQQAVHHQTMEYPTAQEMSLPQPYVNDQLMGGIRSLIQDAVQEGIQKGIQEGIQKGIQEMNGIQEDIHKGIQELTLRFEQFLGDMHVQLDQTCSRTSVMNIPTRKECEDPSSLGISWPIKTRKELIEVDHVLSNETMRVKLLIWVKGLKEEGTKSKKAQAIYYLMGRMFYQRMLLQVYAANRKVNASEEKDDDVDGDEIDEDDAEFLDHDDAPLNMKLRLEKENLRIPLNKLKGIMAFFMHYAAAVRDNDSSSADKGRENGASMVSEECIKSRINLAIRKLRRDERKKRNLERKKKDPTFKKPVYPSSIGSEKLVFSIGVSTDLRIVSYGVSYAF